MIFKYDDTFQYEKQISTFIDTLLFKFFKDKKMTIITKCL